MFRNLRLFFYERSLHKQLQQSSIERQVKNWADAQSIGILFDATVENSLADIRQYIRQLEQKRKRVKVLGYVNKNQDVAHADVLLFSRKHTNWIYQPNHPMVKEFMEQSFDVLVSACLTDEPVLEYVSTFSKAKFRIGPFQENKTHCFDFMINLDKPPQSKEEDNPPPFSPSLMNFFTKVDFYLKQINK